MIRARIDPKIKQSAERVVERIGMSVSELVRILCYHVAATGQIPFDIRVPNKKTVEALNEPLDHLPRFKNSDDLFEELKK